MASPRNSSEPYHADGQHTLEVMHITTGGNVETQVRMTHRQKCGHQVVHMKEEPMA